MNRPQPDPGGRPGFDLHLRLTDAAARRERASAAKVRKAQADLAPSS